MKVLGITAEGDSGATLVEDGRIVSAMNEERVCRMKMVIGFPRLAIREVLAQSQTDVNQLAAVMVASTIDLLADEHEPFDGWFQHEPKGFGGLLKTRGASTFSRFRRYLPILEPAYYALLAPSFWHRRRAIRHILREEFGVRCPILFIDHHFSHLLSAYYTSGFQDALLLSIDGGGDGKSGMVYAVRGGKFEKLHEVSAYNSLGNYYAYVTHLCGFKAMKHEGKITGLAAHGEPKYLPLLQQFIAFEEGTFVNRGGVVRRAAIDKLARSLPKGWSREDLAASIQRHFEDLARRFVQYWARKSGLRNLALSGGVFGNVRVNQEVHELPEVDHLFVHPHMGDGGLGTGAAFAACVPGVLPQSMAASPEPLRDAYLGTDLRPREIEAALEKYGLKPELVDEPQEERIAELLTKGYVVARAAGRMEYGPRALGNRSILYQPQDRKVNDWLNERLHRTEFMPFAPAALYEAREQCFANVQGAEHAAEFMTITFDCSPFTRSQMQGVVHIDGTARPQFVRADRNPGFYNIIKAFHRRTGLPAVINTSFNMHEEPIVCSADDCVRAFLEGNLDYLAIGSHIIKHPRGITHPLVPIRRRAAAVA